MAPADVDIYPLYAFHRRLDVAALHMSWLFHVDDRLDPQILRSTLSQLLQMGDWRKFAGRFKRNSDGLLEIHTPHSFPGDYDIIGYSHRDLWDQKAVDHELVSQIPTDKGPSSLITQHPNWAEFLCHSTALANGTIETWIRGHLPPLALHVTTFEDTTLISLLWRHTIADGGGMADLIHAWSLVLNGQKDEVPSLLGTKENILWHIGDKPRQKGDEEWRMKEKSLGAWAMCKMCINFMWRRLTLPKYEERTILLPAAFIDRLKERSLRELGAGGPQKLPVFSDSLIIRAWFLERIVEAEPAVSNVLLAMPVNPRTRLSEFRQNNGVYVQNMLSWVFVSLSRNIFGASLATIATEVRRRTLEQVTPGQIAAYYDFRHAQSEKRIPTEKVSYFTDNPGNDFLVGYNDLGSLELRERADFGPAVLKNGHADVARGNSSVNPTFFKQTTLTTPLFSVDLRLPYILCNGRGVSGNYLFYAVLSRATWCLMERDCECNKSV